MLAIGAYSTFNTTTAAAPSDRAVNEAQATEIATNALDAFNAGDYAGWTRDWSGAMKDAIREPDGTVLTVRLTTKGAELLINFDGGDQAWMVFGLGVLEFSGD